MTNNLASQTSGFNGERRTADLPPAPQNEPRTLHMFTLKGSVSSLKISDASVDPHQGMPGIGNAAPESATPYDRRIAVQHFSCTIGGRAVTGTFPTVGFRNGDTVKAVVTSFDGINVFAHAVMKTANGRLWLPHGVSKGTHAALIGAAKTALVASFIAWVCALILILQAAPKGGVFVPSALAALAILGVGALGIFLFNRANAQGAYADKILTMLGFSNPRMIDLTPYSDRARNRSGSVHVFELWPALAAYGTVNKTA